MSSFLDNQSPIIMAHRGGGGEAPENTMAAFRNAVKQGFQYLETDVHLAEDGKLYMHHGPFPLRAPSLIQADNPYDELEPLLRDYPQAYISIDPKHELAAEPLAELIAKYDCAQRVAITCPADDRRTARVADRVAELTSCRPLTVLSTAKASLRSLVRSKLIVSDKEAIGASIFYVHHRIARPPLIARLQSEKLKVIVYTVNDPAEMKRLLDWNVDGLMTDYPARAKRFLNQT